MVVCHLAAFDSSLFWISSGRAALTPAWLHSGHNCPLSVTVRLHSQIFAPAVCCRSAPCQQQVLLITPGLSSHQINMWMETRESQLVQYCHRCIAMVAIGIWSSLNTATKPQTDHLWDKPFNHLCTQGIILCTHWYPVRFLKYSFLKQPMPTMQRDTRPVRAGCFYHSFPVKLTSTYKAGSFWDLPGAQELQMDSAPLQSDGTRVHCVQISTRPLYSLLSLSSKGRAPLFLAAVFITQYF